MNEFWINFGEGLGLAVIILSICLGIGGCIYLELKGEALRIQAGNSVTVTTNVVPSQVERK
jgi:hypothetical protein